VEHRAEQVSECAVCAERTRHADGAVCAEGHLICTANAAMRCLQRWAEHCMGEDLTTRRAWDGRVRCPVGGCGAPPFEDPEMARLLPAALFQTYLEKRTDVVKAALWEEFEETEQERRKADVARLDAMNEEATRKLLEQEYPNAVQCPKCGAGPVVPENCYNLATHHGDALAGGGRVSNACPACGFFDSDRGNWAKWDGRMR
jgi:hypothetical protein